MIGPSKGALRSGADMMKIQAQAIAETAEQHERDQEDRERRFVALVYSYLSEHGLAVVPLEGLSGEWISVEDRLPSPNTGVLVFNRYKFIACIQEDGIWFSAEDYETLFQVTHWQPLPSDPTATS
jgi:hypothetical protein